LTRVVRQALRCPRPSRRATAIEREALVMMKRGSARSTTADPEETRLARNNFFFPPPFSHFPLVFERTHERKGKTCCLVSHSPLPSSSNGSSPALPLHSLHSSGMDAGHLVQDRERGWDDEYTRGQRWNVFMKLPLPSPGRPGRILIAIMRGFNGTCRSLMFRTCVLRLTTLDKVCRCAEKEEKRPIREGKKASLFSWFDLCSECGFPLFPHE